MDKRPYTPPTIIRVKLEHQQAVLAACTTRSTLLSSGSGSGSTNCKSTSPACRKFSTTTGRDSTVTS